jgi:hypothetical protein
MNFFTIDGVPNHFTNSNYPGYFDHEEALIAWHIAEDDVRGEPSPTDLELAPIKKLCFEILTRCPQIQPQHLEKGFREIAEYVMGLDRAHLAGPPLRVTWFRLTYFLGLCVFGDAGKPMPRHVSLADARQGIIDAMRELGIEATPKVLDLKLQQFRLEDQHNAGATQQRRHIGLRVVTVLYYLRFLHLAALRHRCRIRIPYSLFPIP